MLKPRDRRQRPRWDWSLSGESSPRVRVALETLEERFLLSGETTKAVFQAYPIDAGTVDSTVDPGMRSLWEVTFGESSVGVAPGGSSDAPIPTDPLPELSAAHLLPSDQFSASFGKLDPSAPPVVYRVPLDPSQLQVQISFSWVAPSGSESGRFLLIDGSSRVVLDQPLTDRPFDVTIDFQANASVPGNALFIELIPDPPKEQSEQISTPLRASSAFELDVDDTLPTPDSAASPGGLSPHDPAASTSPSAPVPVGPPVGPAIPILSTAGQPPSGVKGSFGSFDAPTAGNDYVALPLGRGVPVSGIFASEGDVVSDRADGVVVDPILADLMPGRGRPLPSNAVVERPSDATVVSSLPLVGTERLALHRLAPAATLLIGPIIRLASASDRLCEQANWMVSMVLGTSAPGTRTAYESSEPAADMELAELPVVTPIPELLATASEQLEPEAEDTLPAAPDEVPQGRRPSRYTLLLGSVYASSILIFGVSAPSLSASLKHWRKSEKAKANSIGPG